MSVIDEVINSLRAMNQWQLLLAFVACTAYALAQGGLLSAKGRRIAWSAAALGLLGFVLLSAEWMYAAMLATFAIAGLGLFVGSAWLLSRLLGLSKPRATAEALAFAASVEAEDTGFPPSLSPPSIGPLPLPTPHNGPAHSH